MISNPVISAVVCTHNPRAEYLSRVADGLARQTLAAQLWELIVVDNASDPPLSSDLFSWRGDVRIIREKQVGLTNARLAGINAVSGELIVFIDDDNVIDDDYLEQCHHIAVEFPQLGAWNGQCIGDFVDGQPPEWTRQYWPNIGVHSLDADYWTNHPNFNYQFIPIGAGLAVRRSIALSYAATIKSCPTRSALGRRGSDLMSGEDTDLALTACDLGYGVGRFERLRLTHIIPNGRLTEEYLLRLIEAAAFSGTLLAGIRAPKPVRSSSLVRRIRRTARNAIDLVDLCMRARREQRLVRAERRGIHRAERLLLTLAAADRNREHAQRPKVVRDESANIASPAFSETP